MSSEANTTGEPHQDPHGAPEPVAEPSVSAEPAPVEPAPVEPAPAEPAKVEAAAPAATLEEVLAPGVPRLEAPGYAAKRAPETNKLAPSMLFLVAVAFVSFVSDIGSKMWAEAKLKEPPFTMELVVDHLSLNLAKNKGGAWGLFGTTSESLRLPFFLIVSVLAIWFIMTLYARLHPSQHALRWGLPLVLGGALGNVFDRVRYGYVIDFIDYKAAWVTKMNVYAGKLIKDHYVTDHWPTFNIADVAICVGVGLMAVDMFTSRRGIVSNEPAKEPATA
jgi:signal peptidase II